MAMFNRMNPQDDENNKYNNLMNTNMNKNMNMKISSSSSSLASFEDDTKNTQEQLNTLQKLIQAKHTLTKSPNRAKNYKQLAIILGGIGSQWEFMGTKLIYFSNIGSTESIAGACLLLSVLNQLRGGACYCQYCINCRGLLHIVSTEAIAGVWILL